MKKFLHLDFIIIIIDSLKKLNDNQRKVLQGEIEAKLKNLDRSNKLLKETNCKLKNYKSISREIRKLG